MTVNGKTRVCGIMGNPVEHSMSPLLQGLYARSTGVNLVYVPFQVKEEAVGAAVEGAYSLNLLGMNVTVPHKQRVMEHLSEIDETARDIGAVNTLVRMEQGYKGYNTDVPGLLRAVREAGLHITGRECILIGAGGAAKAGAYMLLMEGASRIYILNRSEERAVSLAEELNRKAEARRARSGRSGGQAPLAIPLALSEYAKIPRGKYFALQTTSVGMHPETNAAPIEDPAFYENIDEAFDAIYTPAETKFMRYVNAAGGRAVNGLDMLLYQGVIAFELWNPGVTVSQEAIGEARRQIRRLLSDRMEDRTDTSGQKAGCLILIGFMGVGKTSVGACYAKRCGLSMVDTDELVERKAGMTISELFASRGEEAFRRMETQILEELLEGKYGSPDRLIISAGGGLPLREENRELLARLGTVVYLKALPGTVVERLRGDHTRPLLQGGNVRERVETLLSARGPLYEEISQCCVSVDGKELEQIVDEIAAIHG